MRTIRIVFLAIFIIALFLTPLMGKGSTPPTKHQDGSVTYYNDDGTESHTVWPDGTKVTYEKDGGKTYTYPDGSKIVIDKDKKLTWYDKDGNAILSLNYSFYDNGHYSKDKDGTINYYSHVGSKVYKYRTKHPDGSVTTYNEDGTIRSKSDKDKKTTFYDEDGNVEEVFYYDKTRNMHYKKHEDGSRTYYNNDFTGWPIPVFTIHSDGSITYYNTIFSSALGHKSHTEHPDGSVTYYGFDKKIYTKHPDGSVTYYTFPTEKKRYTEHPSGNISWYDEDGDLYRVTHPNGSVTYYKNGKEWYTEDSKGNKSYYHEETKKNKVAKEDVKFWEDDYDIMVEIGEGISLGNKTETGLWNKIGKKDKDGDTTVDHPDGSKTVYHEDGSMTYYDEDGKITHKINIKDRSVTYFKDGKEWYTEDKDGKKNYHYHELDDEKGIFVDDEFLNSTGFKGTASDIGGGEDNEDTGDENLGTNEVYSNDEFMGELETGTESGYDETGLDMGIYDSFGDPGTGMEGGYDAIGGGMGPDTGTSDMIMDLGVHTGPILLE